MARVQKLNKTIDTAANTVSIAFSNGKSLVGGLSEFTQEIVYRLALFGLSEKLGNTNAGVTDVDKGFEIMSAALDNLRKGIFNATRSAGEGASRGSLLIEAIVRVSKNSTELPEMDLKGATALVEQLSEEQLKMLRGIPEVRVAMKEIQLERAKAEAAEPGKSLADFLK